jgi:diacylglycerol kinase (ATP)
MPRKLRIFFSGLKFAVRHDRSVAIQMIVSLIVLAISFGLREWLDFVFVLVITGYMLITEIFNSAIEALCDYVQPEHDPRIGAIKDVAAAAVGLSVIIWAGALLFEVIRIWTRLQGN